MTDNTVYYKYRLKRWPRRELQLSRSLAHSHYLLSRTTVDTRGIRTPEVPASPPSTEEERLARLEERLRHELMDDEERQALRDREKMCRTAYKDVSFGTRI